MPIRLETRYVPPSDDGFPALAVQATCLVNSYMLWVGATAEKDPAQAAAAGRLAADWACAMPPVGTRDASGTPLFRSSSSDAALAMSQRLARRFKKQIFLSIDLPTSPLSAAQNPRVLLEVEKLLVKTVKELEG